MVFRCSVWSSVVVAVTLLAAGCRGGASPYGAQKTSIPAPPPQTGAPAIAETNSSEDRIEAHAHYGAGVIHELNDELGPALQEYYEAAMEDPGSESLVLEVSRRFLQVKQPEKALEILIRAAALPTASSTIFARLAAVYSKLGKSDLAAKASRTAIKKDPRSLAGYQNAFLEAMQSGRQNEALRVLGEAAAVSRTDPDFLIGLAELYANFGLQVPAQKSEVFAKALAVLDRAEKMNIVDPDLQLRLADAYNILGKNDAASKIYVDLLKRLPDTSFVRENIRAKLADLYLRERDHKGAVEQLEAILRENPTDAQAYYFLGGIAYEDRDYAKAADCLGKTILLNPDFEQAYYDLAGAQMNAGRIGEAQATLARARQKFPQNFTQEYLSGMVASRAKEYTNAVAHFTGAEVIAQATDPKRLTSIFYFQFGAACERAGDLAQAEKNFQKCLQMSPGFAEALNYLGYMWAEHGEKLDTAREFIAKALQAEPNNAAYLDSMGWVLFKLKQPKEALDYLLKAVHFSEEEDATLYDHLGDVYAALGETEKAREAWRKSMALEPSGDVRKKLDHPDGK